MQLVKWIATGLLVLPLAEFVAFVLVASQVGFIKALVLVILISFLGVLVLRHAGTGEVTRLRTAAGRGEFRGIAASGPAAGTALGGILMVNQGFSPSAPGRRRPAPSTSHRRNGGRCRIRSCRHPGAVASNNAVVPKPRVFRRLRAE
jgi:hypothetical protein